MHYIITIVNITITTLTPRLNSVAREGVKNNIPPGKVWLWCTPWIGFKGLANAPLIGSLPLLHFEEVGKEFEDSKGAIGSRQTICHIETDWMKNLSVGIILWWFLTVKKVFFVCVLLCFWRFIKGRMDARMWWPMMGKKICRCRLLTKKLAV